MRLEAGQVINRPVEEVFRFVATDHFKNHPKWDPAVEEMTPTSPGPMAPGATARLVRRDGSKATPGTITVCEYEPPHAFAAVSRFGSFTLRQQVALEATDQGNTRVHLVIDTAATGPARLLLPLLKGRFSKTMARSLTTIKQHVEGQAAR